MIDSDVAQGTKAMAQKTCKSGYDYLVPLEGARQVQSFATVELPFEVLAEMMVDAQKARSK